MEIVVFWVLFGLLAAYVASNRGEGAVTWFIFGVLFGPIALVLALFTGQRCPHCQTRISRQASVCPNCQREITQSPQESETEIIDPVSPNAPITRQGWIFMVLFAAAILAFVLWGMLSSGAL